MRITETEIERKLNRIISYREMNDLQSISIFELSPNYYSVFGKYYINKKSKTSVEVLELNGELVHTFFSMRNAICWCINDLRGKYISANRVITLDKNISNEEAQIAVHKLLFKKAKNTDDKLIFLAKLNEEKLKRSKMMGELESYIIESNYWQQSKFNLKTEY
jgi:hypothetical protein